jgi:hypothetical protein
MKKVLFLAVLVMAALFGVAESRAGVFMAEGGVRTQAGVTYQLYPDICINQVCSMNAYMAPIPTDPTGGPSVTSFYASHTYGKFGAVIDGVSFSSVSPTGSGIAQASDGRQVDLQTTWTTKVTCTRSGRGQHCTTYYILQSASITPYW